MLVDDFLIVIVLYKTKLCDSVTYTKLIKDNQSSKRSYNILVYDNSPTIQEYKKDEINLLTYISDNTNPGVAKAYNKALEICLEREFSWMLLLDQDTELNANFFSETEKSLLQHKNQKDIVCVIPKITSKLGDVLSPVVLKLGGRVGAIKDMTAGVQQNNISGINSGTLISSTFMKKLGGFNESFPLDMLDHWLFRAIHKSGNHIFLNNAIIQHDLSIIDFEKNMTIDRYKKLLVSEQVFLKGHFIDLFVYKLRLIIRLIKQLFYKDKKFVLVTLKSFFL